MARDGRADAAAHDRVSTTVANGRDHSDPGPAAPTATWIGGPGIEQAARFSRTPIRSGRMGPIRRRR
jgi:hypothetical protein